MATVYVLDQVAPLEGFMVGIIEYFEWSVRGKTIPKTHLPQFMPAITLVEDWMKHDVELRLNTVEKAEYEQQFTKLVKVGMEGLLEPYGDLLK